LAVGGFHAYPAPWLTAEWAESVSNIENCFVALTACGKFGGKY
jgi:hypothetical protein